MKKLHILLLSAVSLIFVSCMSTNVQPIERQEIFEVPGSSKESLFVRANSVAVDMFNNAKSVIQFSDKDAGIIKGKFVIQNITSGLYIWDANVVITIEIKDSKIRMTFSDIVGDISGNVLKGRHSSARSEIIDESSSLGKQVSAKLDEFTETFKKKMNVDDSNW